MYKLFINNIQIIIHKKIKILKKNSKNSKQNTNLVCEPTLVVKTGRGAPATAAAAVAEQRWR